MTRYDTAGNAVDAHDGDLALFGDTYYLYRTSYGLQVIGTRFCGFKVYSSPDLVHWTDRGHLFEPNSRWLAGSVRAADIRLLSGAVRRAGALLGWRS